MQYSASTGSQQHRMMNQQWIMGRRELAYTYFCVLLVGLSAQLSAGCSDKNVIEALYACSKPRENLNRAGKSAQSTHYQICQAFEQYVNCMEPRVRNCDKKLIEAYTVMKQRYSLDGRFNCDASPTIPSTTTTTSTTMEPTTEEYTSPSTTAEATESTTEFHEAISSDSITTTEVFSSDPDTHTEPNSGSRLTRGCLPIAVLSSSCLIWLSLQLLE